ncbi:MAG: aminotransferase class I/II-fold pyridoxal phosphate-dependent enzyme [Candidatus Aenigmatarchaeota archaeon]
MTLNKQAIELNRRLNPVICDLLSERGKAIFFPKEGIVAQGAEAEGKRINATIGIATQDDNTPMRLSSIADKILLNPKDVFPYASSYGKPVLRKLWREMIYRKNPSLKAEISLPVATHALTHALSMAGYLFVEKGDHILLPDKLWGNYRLIFENAYGGVLETFNTFKNGMFDIKSFKEKLSGSGKNIILLNFPNNPTGYTPTNDEAGEIADAIKSSEEAGNKNIVIIDDAYFGFVYKDGIYRESIFSMLSDIHENVLAVKIDGPTKEMYAWGLRVGFITYGFKGAREEDYKVLEDKTAGAVRGNISSASQLSQSLVLHSIQSSYEKEAEKNFNILKTRFEKVEDVLKNKKYAEYFHALPFNSGYFMCVELKGIDAEKVRQTLLKKYDTGVISIGNMLRIAFSSVAENDIESLFENIFAACNDVKHGASL